MRQPKGIRIAFQIGHKRRSKHALFILYLDMQASLTHDICYGAHLYSFPDGSWYHQAKRSIGGEVLIISTRRISVNNKGRATPMSSSL